MLFKGLNNYKVLRGELTIKWWKLNSEVLIEFKVKLIERRPWGIDGDGKEMWTSMASCIKSVGKDVLWGN